jgi:tRNA-specific 2-thiouridylase
VLAKDGARNALIVGYKHELGTRELLTEPTSWLSGHVPIKEFDADVKIRYSARKAQARVTPLADGRARVAFSEAMRDITPGQAAVFYRNGEVLGGGLIAAEPGAQRTQATRLPSEAIPVL